ncbi:MAG: DUF1570 domain-containing protein, partial [Planctomycetota bacterium]
YSDIDENLCREAARLLEESFTSYLVHLEKIGDIEKKKFPVYLFSGQAGYLMYLRDLTILDNIQSLGCYVPALRQLMIWNTPDRESMLRTIRHEGFHQYMHRLSEEPPIWLNEGLAEYYEIAERVGGDWKLGKTHPDHVHTLAVRKQERIPLKEFLHCSASDFRKKTSLYYAQSWAFIHFLRHSTRENSALFTKLLEASRRKTSPEEIVTDFLQGVDLDLLQEEFSKHLESMS